MKTIPGFPDYCVTKDGRIWSKPRKDALGHNLKGKWLKPGIRNNYLFVVLYIDSQGNNCYIHRLVLETYVGSSKGMQCRHLDGNPKNNNLENLCWGTYQENHQDSIRHGTNSQCPVFKGEKHPNAKLTNTKVRIIRYLRKVAKFTLTDLAWQFDVDQSTIGRVIRKETWKHLYAEI